MKYEAPEATTAYYTCSMRHLQLRPFTAVPLHNGRHSSVQTGFSIIEVLVAIIILSIGMLGAVGMQTAALQSNKESRNSAVATSFGRELAEKMRTNKAVAIRSGTGAVNPYLFDVTLGGSTTVATPSQNCATVGCPLAEDVARWDVADWQLRAQQEIPSPHAKVCFDNDPYDSAGKPRWACTDTGDIAVLKLSWNRTNTAGKLTFTSDTLTDTPALVVSLTSGSTQ